VGGGEYEIMPGHGEAITYTVAGALLGDGVKSENVEPAHLQVPIGTLLMGGAQIARRPTELEVSRGERLAAISVVTGSRPTRWFRRLASEARRRSVPASPLRRRGGLLDAQSDVYRVGGSGQRPVAAGVVEPVRTDHRAGS
jgi:hypothetical protein